MTNLMAFNEFLNWLLKELTLVFGEKIISHEEGTDYIFVTLGETDNVGSVKARFNAYNYYEEVYEKGVDEEAAIEEIENYINDMLENPPYEVWIAETFNGSIDDFDYIKDELIIRARPMAKIQADNIYEEIDDIALQVGIYVKTEDNYFTTIVPNSSILKSWGKTTEEVLEIAKENTYKLFPPRYIDMRHIGFTKTLEEADLDEPSLAGYCVSTVSTTNGASIIFTPYVRRFLGEKFGDFYICFTSIHEVMIHPVSFSFPVEQIKEVLIDTIQYSTSSDDFLTYSVYRYYADEDRISRVPVSRPSQENLSS